MNQETFQNRIKQTFESSNITACKNTELYKLFDIKDNCNPYKAIEILNDYLYNTVKDGYSNGIYMPTLAAYLFFKRNKKDLLDNLAVYKTAQKPYITIKKEIPEGYVTLRQWMARTMQLYGKHHLANSFKKVKQLIIVNEDLKNYLKNYLSNNFFLMEPTENITILGNYNNPSTNLKNLVVFENLKDAIGALLYKTLKDNITVKQALAETNFVVLNNKQNILNKLDDIVLYSSLTNTQNIIVNENIAPEIVTALQGKNRGFL